MRAKERQVPKLPAASVTRQDAVKLFTPAVAVQQRHVRKLTPAVAARREQMRIFPPPRSQNGILEILLKCHTEAHAPDQCVFEIACSTGPDDVLEFWHCVGELVQLDAVAQLKDGLGRG